MASKRLLPPILEGKCPIQVLGLVFPDDPNLTEDQLEQEFSESVIKKAYRNMARVTHPDKNPDDPNAKEKFDMLQKAYEWILQEGHRQDYFMAIVRERATRKRYLERDGKKNQMASTLAEKEKAAAEARAKMGVGGYGSNAARRYTDWANKQEELAAQREKTMGADDAAYNLIKRLRRTTGEGVTVPSGMSDKYNPANIARDTWSTIRGEVGAASQKPVTTSLYPQNKMNFRGKWRDPKFVRETIAECKDIFLAYEEDTLNLLRPRESQPGHGLPSRNPSRAQGLRQTGYY